MHPWDATLVQCRLQRHVCRLPLRRDARDFRGCGGKCGESLQVFLACSIAPPWDGSPCREGHPQDLSVHLGTSDQVPEFEDTSGAMVALWCSWGRTGPCPKAPEGHHRATIVCIRGQATLAHARGRPPHCIRVQATLARSVHSWASDPCPCTRATPSTLARSEHRYLIRGTLGWIRGQWFWHCNPPGVLLGTPGFHQTTSPKTPLPVELV